MRSAVQRRVIPLLRCLYILGFDFSIRCRRLPSSDSPPKAYASRCRDYTLDRVRQKFYKSSVQISNSEQRDGFCQRRIHIRFKNKIADHNSKRADGHSGDLADCCSIVSTPNRSHKETLNTFGYCSCQYKLRKANSVRKSWPQQSYCHSSDRSKPKTSKHYKDVSNVEISRSSWNRNPYHHCTERCKSSQYCDDTHPVESGYFLTSHCCYRRSMNCCQSRTATGTKSRE